MATAHNPSEPAPYTSARPERVGGWRVIACKDTENGSAKTAASTGTLGTPFVKIAADRGKRTVVEACYIN
ncbi:hypothetical protein MSG_00942 [Mycobacterium shigaense]|uniref:Uncharacterized protein n=1 Tax=Mycobacterium shigaense TaxID=722731 RepID=A0A1Z4EDP9_9MYCO|nr:hypothetical protein MSG_00942 [Mycobacterium shigaense]